MTRTIPTTLAFVLALAAGPLAAQAGPGAPPDKPLKKPAAKSESTAPTAGAASMPKPDAEMSQLKFIVGVWQCTGRGEASPAGPAHATVGTARATADLGGFFVTGRYEETRTPENPNPVRYAFTWAHDAKDKRFIAWGFDSFGGISKQVTNGWDGDKLAWSGETLMNGASVPARDTFTRKGETELTHMAEIQMNGQWQKLDEETCTKAAPRK